MSASPLHSPLTASPGIAPPREATFLSTTVGKKVVMAVSGVILFGFVIGHMLGNLQVFLGPRALNDYAVALREIGHGAVLWTVRAVLLAAVVLHVWAAVALTFGSWAARPYGYKQQRSRESTYASRTMRWSGPLLALFIVYHLMHLTFGNVHPGFHEGDAYGNVVAGFRVFSVSVFYILAQLALGLHLYHGGWSMLQTFGLSHPRYNRWRFALSTLLTAAVVAGNIAVPVAVMTGFVR